MSNEVLFNNLQDDIVYHANIFNYDKQFLMNLLKFNIKLDFAEYSQAKGQDLKPTIEFLKKKSREQVDLMTYAVYNEFNQLPEDLDPELVQKKVQDSKAATKALRHLFNLFTYSYEKAEEKAKVIEGSSIEAGELYANNLIACLLYWDGISMVNIDIVKLIENGAGYTGKSFKEFIFMILNNKKFDYHIQEIASHILSIDLMVNYENTFPQQEIDIPEASKELMKWTYEICIQKQRDSCLTSNLSLLLTIGENIDYFLGEFNEEFPCIRKIFELMTEADININIIYECLLCMWNISSNKKYFYFFENRDHKYIEKIVQVIRTNKIDKVARIGLMT